MNEERLNYVQHYLKLSEKLRHIRKENAGAESVEEDELLEEMDAIWWALSSEEIAELKE